MTDIGTIEEIKKIISEHEKVLLFVADHYCSTAQALDYKIEEFAAAYPDLTGIRTNLKMIPTLASEYMILAAPTVVFFREGKEVFREGRFLQFEQLEAVVQ